MLHHPTLVFVLPISLHVILSLHLSFTSLPFILSFHFSICLLLYSFVPLTVLLFMLSLFYPTFPSLLTCLFFFFLLPSMFLLLWLYSTLCPHHPVWLPAPFRRDSSNCGQGAGRADQRASASWRCAIHSAGHGPTGRTAGRPAQEPHPRGQGQRSPQPHQGTASRNPCVGRSMYW